MILTAIEITVAITCTIGLTLDFNDKPYVAGMVKSIGLTVIALIGLVGELQ